MSKEIGIKASAAIANANSRGLEFINTLKRQVNVGQMSVSSYSLEERKNSKERIPSQEGLAFARQKAKQESNKEEPTKTTLAEREDDLIV